MGTSKKAMKQSRGKPQSENVSFPYFRETCMFTKFGGSNLSLPIMIFSCFFAVSVK